MIPGMWKLYAAIAGLGLLAVIGWRVYDNIYDAGAQDAIREIEKVNDELESNAIDAREGRSRCFDANGMWDFTAGRCIEAETDSGI